MWPGRSCSRVGELGRGDVAIICLSPVVRQRAAYHLARPGAREPTAARLTMLRHPSWNGLDKPSSIDLYRDSSCDIEEACCNRRRSHSHDLPDAWDRRRRCVLIGAAGLLLFRAYTPRAYFDTLLSSLARPPSLLSPCTSRLHRSDHQSRRLFIRL